MKDSKEKVISHSAAMELIRKFQSLRRIGGPFPDAPNDVMDAVRNAAKATGQPVPMVVSQFDQHPLVAGSTVTLDGKEGLISLHPGIGMFYTPKELEAIIAHELGHIFHQDPQHLSKWAGEHGMKETFVAAGDIPNSQDRQQQFIDSLSAADRAEFKQMMHGDEFDADAFAAVSGYRTALISSLRRYHTEDNINQSSDSHPSVQERVDRLMALPADKAA